MDEQAKIPTTRLFLALWPAPSVRHLLAEWRDAWTWPAGAAPVHADKLHVTLHFLGALPSERLSELLDGFAVPFVPFRLDLTHAALWHNGIAVLEPSLTPPALRPCTRACRTRCWPWACSRRRAATART
ncbi:2'-5' RNA ligase family protein [Massilia alkalitolerans]|uniref:2'-5' RNA ligase family protein n=1 Tax=Massilia alkalitolerans TaxID=286638 RepID=UPI00040B0EAE|nr:2'-5' RNA ligase family protein [Massilia alkalitolerans]